MPFVNRKFYMNPGYGRGVERTRLRATGAENEEPHQVDANDAPDGHWVTIDQRHIFIREPDGL